MSFSRFCILSLVEIFLVSTSILHSQSTTFSHQYFRVEEGLVSNVTSCIFKDSRGLLWIGTIDKGLSIYDGQTFHPYPISIEKGTEKIHFNNLNIEDICEDDAGNMWVATETGLFIISLAKNSTTVVPLSKSSNNRENGCSFITKAKDGKMYVIKRKDNKLIVIDQDLNIDATKFRSIENIHELVEDSAGNIWYSSLVSEGSLYKIEANQNSTSSIALTLPSHFSFAKTKSGAILLVQLTDNKIYQLDSVHESIKQYEDKEYQIDHSTLGKGNSSFSNLLYLTDQLFDNNGHIWLTTEQGLHYIQAYKRKLPFQSLPVLSGKSLRLISKQEDGGFYVSTTKSFYELNPNKDSLRQLHMDIDVCQISSLRGDSLLLNVSGANHFILNQKTKELSELKLKTNTKVDFHNTYTSIRNQKGEIFSGGFRFMELDSMTYITDREQTLPFKRNPVYAYLKDSHNPAVIWAGTAKGLYKIEDCQIDRIDIKPEGEIFGINALYQWNEEELIIGGKNDGVYHFHLHKGLLAVYNTENGLSDNRIACIQSNDNRGIWVSTFNGLNYINLVEKSIQSFYEKDGLTNNEFNSFSTYKSEEGDIWFGGVKGCTIIPKNLKTTKQAKHKLNINSYGKIDKATQMFNRIFLSSESRKVVLEADEKYIEFHFGNSNFADNNTTRYAYFLKGMDEDWIYSKKQRSARYNNLSAGEYQFQVKMKPAHGNWQETENPINLEVKVYFYERSWFKGAMLFLALFSLYCFVRYRIKQLRKVQQLKEKLARDLHDDVGSTLHGIHRVIFSLRNESTSKETFDAKLDTIEKLSKGVVHNMNDVVWSISGENNTFGDLEDKIIDFADDVLVGSNINFSCSFEQVDTNKILEFNARYHLMMICKEGINNALKHCQGEDLHLSFKEKNGYFYLTLKNNFKTFQKAKVSGLHGLKNMKQRAKALKASIDFETGEHFFRIVLKRKAF